MNPFHFSTAFHSCYSIPFYSMYSFLDLPVTALVFWTWNPSTLDYIIRCLPFSALTDIHACITVYITQNVMYAYTCTQT
ncbi:unnamed protein product [Brassica oleracea]